jgi:molybdopterin-containing oxidoreductase family membrane subunit
MSNVFYENTAQSGTVKSVFSHLDSLINAVDALEKNGIKAYIVASPLPRHDLEEVIYKGRPSPVRWFTLAGAIFGGTMGFSLASLTHLNWAMIIPGGKPLVSIPAFIVITFESTVMWGCLFTLIGMVILTRLASAQKLQVELCDPRYSDDKFGLVINDLKREKAESVVKLLQQNGALEVINGYTEEFVDLGAHEEAPTQHLFEPDEIETGMLNKLAVVTTVLIFLSFVFVKLLFDFTIASSLEGNGYNYSNKAVAPSYRTVE